MITLLPATAAMLYLLMTLTVLLGLWISQHYKTRGKKLSLEEHELLICEYCHNAYLGNKIKTVTQCPQCKSYNKNNRYHPS